MSMSISHSSEMQSQKLRKGVDWRRSSSTQSLNAAEVFLDGGKNWPIAGIILVFSMIVPLWILLRAFFGASPAGFERGMLVSFFLCYAFLTKPLGRKSWQDKPGPLFLVDILCVLLILAVGLYKGWSDVYSETFYIYVTVFSTKIRLDIIVGVVAVLLVLEAARRVVGWTLVILPVAIMLYTLFCNHLPGLWGGPAIPWQLLIDQLYIQPEGMYGSGAYVIIAVVFLFLFFGVILKERGAANFIIDLANSLVGHMNGGPAKVAVFASGGVGMMSGSPTSNVAITGAFTIPMMRNLGHEPEFAAAVETVASSGGCFMPPVMGTVGFLMAAFLGIPYFKITLFAIIPAILYYLSVFAIVHFKGEKLGLKGLPREELPSTRRVLLEGGHLLIPVILVFVTLFVGYSVTRVGFFAVISALLLVFAGRQTRYDARQFLSMFDEAMNTALVVAVACTVVGLVMGPVASSGLGMRLSTILITISGSSLFLLLTLAGILIYILGMGMPPIIIYVLMLGFFSPAMIRLGLPPVVAHFFILYWSATSALTPPFCLAAFVAAGIAGAPPMRTGFTAMNVGIATYVIPFAFCYRPELLLQGGGIGEIAFATVSAAIGVIFWAITVTGYFLRNIPFYARIFALAGGVLCFFPTLVLNLIGIGLFVSLLFLQMKTRHKGGNEA